MSVSGLLSDLTAVAALSISILTLWLTILRKVKISIVPDDEIRLRQFPRQTGWNLPFTITASGPESTWRVVKFTQTNFDAPDGHTYKLLPTSHLSHVGLQQRSASPNVPIPIKGGDSKSVIIGYQSGELPTWQQGEYHLRFAAVDTYGDYITIAPKRFVLSGHTFRNVQNPQNDQIIVLLPETESPKNEGSLGV